MIGTRIKEAREIKGLSQRQLAIQLGIQASSVNSWESEKKSPTIDRLVMVAFLLNVSLEWLATGRGAMVLYQQNENQLLPPDEFNEWQGTLAALSKEQRKQLFQLITHTIDVFEMKKTPPK